MILAPIGVQDNQNNLRFRQAPSRTTMVTIGEAFSPVDGIVYSTSDVKVKIGDSIIAPVGALHLTER